MTLFNEIGRRIPRKGLRVFDETPKTYYRLDGSINNYSDILKNSIQFGGVDSSIDVNIFKAACENLRKKFENNITFKNLFNGVAIPFICKSVKSLDDLGRDLHNVQLPNLQRAFNNNFPNNHFKAILQSNTQLENNVSIDPRSRYQTFVNLCKTKTIIGWYFPQALQEFDIESQREQMLDLPDIGNVCLSGGIDIIGALIGNPQLLISEKNYSPILCMSAYCHKDPRMILLIKSYGPHMEFWCMTQMLTTKITQVSEQWAGGITIFDSFAN
jgi:hypothetical protein